MDKFCRYYAKDLPFNNFKDGLKICKTYLEYKRKNYNKHKNKVNKIRRIKYKENKEYKKKNRNKYKIIVIKLPFVMYVIHQ